MRLSRGQPFVMGGYTIGGRHFDALIFGYYSGDALVYAAKTRNAFTPHSRAQLARRFSGLEINDCPFVNLPQKSVAEWAKACPRGQDERFADGLHQNSSGSSNLSTGHTKDN